MHPVVIPIAFLLLTTMATMRPESFSMITINGEEYMPTPHDVHLELPENMVWSSFHRNSLFLSDPEWWDPFGQDQIKQRRIWAVPSESGQVDQFRQLLHELPDRALDMMFAAAAKGKPHVVRFLLEQGVKASANEADGDDMSLVPLHAAAYQGRLECVKILMVEGKLDPNTRDDMGGIALMRACWGKHPDIVEYLLAAGADTSIQQKASEDSGDETGANAFNFAGGSGCLECAKLLVKHTEGLGLPSTDLITPRALAAAAQSDDLEILRYFLKTGGYYQTKGDDLSERGIGPLINPMKEAIEGALLVALQRGGYRHLKLLYAFIDSRTANNEYQWTSLKDDTVDALIEALWQLAAYNDEQHLEAFKFISEDILAQTSRFTIPATQERKATVLNDAYFHAAQKGCLVMMKLIETSHDTLNVNHLAQYLKPKYATPLYTAAGSGFDSIVEHLLDVHGDQLNVHLGAGEFANGPTALWNAVINGQREVVKLLLERAGGPVEIFDKTAKPAKGKNRIVLTAARDTNGFVGLASEAVSRAMYGDFGALEGSVTDSNGGEGKYVLLEFEEGDLSWWDKLQVRKSDDELLLMEVNGRTLKENLTSV
jgi:hypothetical protein